MEGLLVKGGDEAGRGGGAVGIVASLRVEGDSGSSICSTERGRSKAQLATTYIIFIIVLSGVHLGRSNAIRLGMVGAWSRPNKRKKGQFYYSLLQLRRLQEEQNYLYLYGTSNTCIVVCMYVNMYYTYMYMYISNCKSEFHGNMVIIMVALLFPQHWIPVLYNSVNNSIHIHMMT